MIDYSYWKKLNEKFNILYIVLAIIGAFNIILTGLLIGLIVMFAYKSQIMSTNFDDAMDMIINTPPPEPICNCFCNCTPI
jgi:hypothetical protein